MHAPEGQAEGGWQCFRGGYSRSASEIVSAEIDYRHNEGDARPLAGGYTKDILSSQPFCDRNAATLTIPWETDDDPSFRKFIPKWQCCTDAESFAG